MEDHPENQDQTNPLEEMNLWVNQLPVRCPSMVGPLESGKIRMPLESDNGTHLTWTKWVQNRSNQIVNAVTSRQSCWFVRANKSDGTHQTKISSTGGSDKFQTTRIMKVLQDPSHLKTVESKEANQEYHFAHRCSNGKGKGKDSLTCINPYHVDVVSCQINQSHKNCKFGCRFLCPHENKCIFTWHDTGLIKPCFMSETEVPMICPHERTCRHSLN